MWGWHLQNLQEFPKNIVYVFLGIWSDGRLIFSLITHLKFKQTKYQSQLYYTNIFPIKSTFLHTFLKKILICLFFMTKKGL